MNFDSHTLNVSVNGEGSSYNTRAYVSTGVDRRILKMKFKQGQPLHIALEQAKNFVFEEVQLMRGDEDAVITVNGYKMLWVSGGFARAT